MEEIEKRGKYTYGDVSMGQGNCYKQEAQRATYRAPEYNVPPF